MNLTEILKDVPKGTELYSTVHGVVKFKCISINDNIYPIQVVDTEGYTREYTEEGKYYANYTNAECILFPSKDNRDWNTFVPDLPALTPCICFEVIRSDFRQKCLRYYHHKGHVFMDGLSKGDDVYYSYIIPCDKYNFVNNTFDLKDNYGGESYKKV